MTLTPSLPWPSDITYHKTLLFAQEVDQDLDFDDELEEIDDYDPKPPSRRPLVLIFLLLIVASVGYFMMEPGAFSSLNRLTSAFSSLTSMVMAPGSKTPAPKTISKAPAPREKSPPMSSGRPPVPTFQEGQLVTILVKPSGPFSLKLSGDAEGREPGPLVKAGEPLTILDGLLVTNTWTYFVHTESGASGWISEYQLKAKS